MDAKSFEALLSPTGTKSVFLKKNAFGMTINTVYSTSDGSLVGYTASAKGTKCFNDTEYEAVSDLLEALNLV